MKKVKKWYIYLANLDPAVGSEQGKTPPVLVISEDDINKFLNCVNIIPITTRQTNRFIYPNEVLLPKNTCGLPNESIALCHQIRTIDKSRLTSTFGEIEISSIKNNIYDAITFQLGLSYF